MSSNIVEITFRNSDYKLLSDINRELKRLNREKSIRPRLKIKHRKPGKHKIIITTGWKQQNRFEVGYPE